jgi:ectoine hydroxylase-related dioxygenase (phytanoyl-CoA dioxygenase family)
MIIAYYIRRIAEKEFEYMSAFPATRRIDSSPSNEEIAQADIEGYYVARRLFSPEEIEMIRDTFVKQVKDGPVPGLSETRAEYTEDDPLRFYPRMMNPAEHSEFAVGPLAMRYMLDDRLHEILKVLMHDEPIAAQSMFYFKPPGARGQAMHQDNYYLRVSPGTCFAAWIAIDNADEGNGGMKVIPGTHTMAVVCPGQSDRGLYFTTEHIDVPGKDPVHVDLKSGDCLFFNGSLVHGSSPNTSPDRFRRALIFHYTPEHSEELSRYYANPRRFDGTLVGFAPATGGGPCGGDVAALPTSPH